MKTMRSSWKLGLHRAMGRIRNALRSTPVRVITTLSIVCITTLLGKPAPKPQENPGVQGDPAVGGKGPLFRVLGEHLVPVALPGIGVDTQYLWKLAAWDEAQMDRAGDEGVDARPAATARRRLKLDQEVVALEAFLKAYPESAWSPSIMAMLGRHYRNTGRYSLALERWEECYLAVRAGQTQAARRVGDFAYAHLTRLLASLGRTVELGALFKAEDGRSIRPAYLAQMVWETREAYARMLKHPEVAYKCGVYALNNAARVLKGENDIGIVRQDSRTSGFALAELARLARERGLPLAPLVRSGAQAFPVPCVVHWKLDHYAAVVGFEAGLYTVVDPTFGGTLSMTEETLMAEASGYILGPVGTSSPGWAPVTDAEAAGVFGKGYAWVMDSSGDIACGDCPCPPGRASNGATGSSSSGSNGSLGFPSTDPRDQVGLEFSGGKDSPQPHTPGAKVCCNGTGMPTWHVSEPFLNLWLTDRPAVYTPAYGPAVDIQLTYRTRPDNAFWGMSHFGDGWRSVLLSYVDVEKPVRNGNTDDVYQYPPSGGRVTFRVGPSQQTSAANYLNYDVMTLVYTNGTSSLISVEVARRDGSKLVYGRPSSNGYKFFLTRVVDPQGLALTYTYCVPGIGNCSADYPLVSTITDATGGVTHFYHEDAVDVTAVTSIVLPDSNAVHFTYDDGLLTSITDAAGIASTISYDGAVRPASITTPYGTTSFEYISGDGTSAGHPDRAVIVSEPEGKRQIYALVVDAQAVSGFPGSYATNSSVVPQVPYGTFAAGKDRHFNSFYWNRLQSANVGADPASFAWSDYLKARRYHWLGAFVADGDHGIDEPSSTLDFEQLPSLDGSTPGQTTWYDYAGKTSGDTMSLGSQSYPSTMARRMPDGTTWYLRYTRNSLGYVTQTDESWVQGGSTQTRTETFLYDSNGLDLLRHVGADGNLHVGYAFTNTYPHRPIRMTNAVGEVTSYTYNANALLTGEVHPGGDAWTTNYYDANGHLISTIDFAGVTSIRTNSLSCENNRVKVLTDARGLSRTNTFDGLGRLLKRAYSDGSSESWTYYLIPGQSYASSTGSTNIIDLTSHSDRMTNITRYTYNGLRQTVLVTDARTNKTAYAYCDCGSPTYITNAFGNALAEVSSHVFDTQGRTIQSYSPLGTGVTNTYDALGRLLVVTDAFGATTNVYDNLGRLVERRNAAGLIASTAYDVVNRATNMVDASGVIKSITYDALGRVVRQATTDGGSIYFGYTANIIAATSLTNPLGEITYYAYDALGRRTNEVQDGMWTNRFTYSPGNDLLTLTDGRSQTTTWVRDNQGRVTAKYDPRGTNIVTYSYNPNGHVVDRWTPAKGHTTFLYDQVGNLTGMDYPSGAEVRYTYDALYRMVAMSDASGDSSYAYYQGGALASEDGPWANDTVSYTYGNTRELLTISAQQPSGSFTVTNAWDSVRRLKSVTSPAGQFAYTYTNNAALTAHGIAWSAGPRITNRFDGLGRMTNTALITNGTAVANSHTYAYNDATRRTRQTRTDSSYVDYTYNTGGELIKAVGSGGNSTENLGYGYDAAMNMTVRTNAGTPGTYTVASQLNQVTADPSYTYTYDANGNRTRRNAGNPYVQYTYDEEDRLSQVATDTIYTTGSSCFRTDFIYDGVGRLRKAVEYLWMYGAWTTNTETRYVYDGRRVIQERDINNTPTVSYTRGWDRSHTLGRDGGIGGMLARSHGYSGGNWSTHNMYHADGNGNVTFLVSGVSAPSAVYRYDPYGRTTYSSGGLASANVYRYSSRLWHERSGLYQFMYRFYDPLTQRWLNRDPIGEWAGPNTYTYVNNEPTDAVDPFGLFVQPNDVIIGIGKGVGVVGIGGQAGWIGVGGGVTLICVGGVCAVAAVPPSPVTYPSIGPRNSPPMVIQCADPSPKKKFYDWDNDDHIAERDKCLQEVMDDLKAKGQKLGIHISREEFWERVDNCMRRKGWVGPFWSDLENN